MKFTTPLVLASLLAAGSCGADTTAAKPPTSSPPAQSASGTAISAALPPALQGQWQPISKALESSGPLILSSHNLQWAPCGSAPQVMQVKTTGAHLLVTLPASCRLDDSPVTHLRVQARADNACELELSLYESASQLAQQQRLAWGVYQRQGCTPS